MKAGNLQILHHLSISSFVKNIEVHLFLELEQSMDYVESKQLQLLLLLTRLRHVISIRENLTELPQPIFLSGYTADSDETARVFVLL